MSNMPCGDPKIFNSITVPASANNSVLVASSGGNPTWTTTSSNYYTISKNKYNILGKEIEGGYDMNLAICVSLINIHGVRLYDELKKQGVTFHGEIGDFLEENLKSYYRDMKIEQVISQ